MISFWSLENVWCVLQGNPCISFLLIQIYKRACARAHTHTHATPHESLESGLSIPQIKVMWKMCCQTGWPIFSFPGILFFFTLLFSISLYSPQPPCLSFWVSSSHFFFLYMWKKIPILDRTCREHDFSVWAKLSANKSAGPLWQGSSANPVLGTCWAHSMPMPFLCPKPATRGASSPTHGTGGQ